MRKSFIKYIYLIALIVLCLFMTVSCGKNNKDDEEDKQTGVITYLVTFNTDGELQTVYAEEGKTILEPASPVKEGYNFDGWALSSGEKWDFSTSVVTKDMTLYASFEEGIYTITIDSDNGTEVVTYKYHYNDTVTVPDTPVKEGYTFMCWNNEFPSKMPQKNLTIKAIWKVNSYTIHYETNGGTVIKDEKLDYGEKITIPENPTREGCLFTGWDMTIPSTMPDHDLTITAEWLFNKYQLMIVNYYGNGKSYVTTQNFGSTYNISDPEVVGYSFKGYYDNQEGTGEVITLTTVPAKDTIIYALFDLNIYTIHYELNGGTNDQENVTEMSLSSKSCVLKPATKEGYYFEGWYTDPELTNKILKITGNLNGDLTLYASYKKIIAYPTLVSDLNYNDENQSPVFNNYDETKLSISGDYQDKKDLGTYRVIFSIEGDYVWADGSKQDYMVEWKINPTKINKPSIDTNTFVYNGSEQSPTWSNINLSRFTVNDDFYPKTNAGDYIAIFTLKTGYLWDDDSNDAIKIDWSITKVDVTINWDNNTLVTDYNGQNQLPSFTYTSSNATKDLVIDYTSYKEAGTYELAIQSINGDSGEKLNNYVVTNEKTTFTINSIAITKIYVDQTEFTYDGKNHMPDIVVYAGSYLCTYYDFENEVPLQSKNAGEYSITITGKGSIIGGTTVNYVIHKGEYNITFNSQEISKKIFDTYCILDNLSNISSAFTASIVSSETTTESKITYDKYGTPSITLGEGRADTDEPCKVVVGVTVKGNSNYDDTTATFTINVSKYGSYANYDNTVTSIKIGEALSVSDFSAVSKSISSKATPGEVYLSVEEKYQDYLKIEDGKVVGVAASGSVITAVTINVKPTTTCTGYSILTYLACIKKSGIETASFEFSGNTCTCVVTPSDLNLKYTWCLYASLEDMEDTSNYTRIAGPTGNVFTVTSYYRNQLANGEYLVCKVEIVDKENYEDPVVQYVITNYIPD